MVFSFICDKCNSRKFFSKVFRDNNNNHFCNDCQLVIDNEQKKKEKKRLYLEKKKKRRIESRNLADFKLKEELKKEKLKFKEKKITKKKRKEKEVIQKIKIRKKQERRFLSDKDLQKLADSYDVLLYVHLTVKRLKAIEWRKGKKKVILNKEREIRRTHKGGWSQEKFQKFVDFQKKHALDWINGILVREGVLRPPYDEIFIESDDDNLKKGVEELLKEINY